MPDELEVTLEETSFGLAGRGSFLPHIAMQVYNTPLMILPQKLEVITKVLGERIGLVGGSIPQSEMVKARLPVKTDRLEIGVVPIIGSLVHRGSGMDAMSGVQSYQKIQRDFREMMSDPRIGSILLDIDSPGGVVAGVFDLADEIHAANEQKPVYAFINEHGYSAAYLLAASAQKIFLPRTGGVGSIGVRMLHVDQSEFNKKAGLKVTNLYVGERKIDFDPNSPLSKEAYESAMDELQEMYALFAHAVSRYRGMTVQDVKGTKAGVFMGQTAVKIGLADEVMTFGEAVSFIGNDLAGNKTKIQAAARRRAGKKEVKRKMPNTMTAEFKAENPEIYDEIRAEVERDLQASFDTERTGFETKVAGLTAELQDRDNQIQEQGARVLKLEKAEFIRAEHEKSTRIANASDKIWTKALAVCDIPERMHAKVRAMVKTDAFVKEDVLDEAVLDEAAYTARVRAEIAEWEGNGMTTSVLGTGFGNKTGDADQSAVDEQRQEEDDDAWVEKMLAYRGQEKKGGEA